MNTKVAIVILNWNGEKLLKKFIYSVIKYSESKDSKIYLVDNNSSDNSVAYIKEYHKSIEVIKLEKNYGFAKGYAMALPMIKAQYFVLLNSDVEVTENWLPPIIEFLDQHDEVAAAMPKLISYKEKDKFEYSGAAGGYIDILGYPFCKGRILNEIEKDEGQYDKTDDIFWATGAALVVKSDCYHEIKGLDGDFFAHMEEIDLCWRLKIRGYKIITFPHSKVYHLGGGTLPTESPRKLFYNHRNNLYMLFKNLSQTAFLPVIIIRLILDFISALTYLLQGKPSFFLMVLKAHIHFYGSLTSLLSKRREVNMLRRNTKISGIYKRSIVWDFFISNHKNYNSLNPKSFI